MSFRSVNYVLSNIVNSDEYKAVFEKRPRRYMFCCKNYGDIPGLLNRADSDPWDCFAPGYEFRELTIGKKYKIKDIIGYYKLKNGNHKIAIQVYVPGFDKDRAKREIKNYCDKYTKGVRVEGEWVCLKKGYELS
tara:strand:+ start:3648 stop:4049 length:402 start_codon:yes stop_codon:yes gene_type:complete